MQALPVPDGKVTLDGGWVHQFRGKRVLLVFLHDVQQILRKLCGTVVAEAF
jgi:hypothetical protein